MLSLTFFFNVLFRAYSLILFHLLSMGSTVVTILLYLLNSALQAKYPLTSVHM